MQIQSKRMNAALFHLGEVFEDFSTDNMRKTGLCGHFYDLSVDHDNIDVNGIWIFIKLKQHDIKQCLDLWKKRLLHY